MEYFKWMNYLMIFESFLHLCYKFGNRHFCCPGYFVSTVGLSESTIIKYVRDRKNKTK